MSSHLRIFKTYSEYQTYISDNPLLPNVSLVGDEIVEYNPESPLSLKFTSNGGNTISLSNNNGNAPTLYYSYDESNWTSWDYSALSIASGESVYIYGINPNGFCQTASKYSNFVIGGNGTVECSGSIMSLINPNEEITEMPNECCFLGAFFNCAKLTTAPELPATILKGSCYRNMFRACSGIITAPALPATILTERCYQNMFYGCTSLTTAPELPATTLTTHCYYCMFYGCTSLTTAPALPATTLANECYRSMFYGCTSLTIAPSSISATTIPASACTFMFYNCTSLAAAPELPATTLASCCYRSMFNGCTSLTTAPALPATTLADNCYCYMFQDCRSLTTAPALPATILANSCYYGMFYGCTNLTTAPVLPATTLADYCYYAMFERCSSLTTAPALPATILANSCYSGMFYGCTSLTTAPALPATILANSCYSGMFYGCTNLTTAPSSISATTIPASACTSMFYGCTSLTSAPVLPTTTLANYCYDSMFSNCTGLTTAPELPATTLADRCYSYMFYGCTSLTAAPVLPATTLAGGCYYGMFNSCSNLTTAPELPATTLATGCYQQMFQNCTSLNTVTCLATDISMTNSTFNWLSNVASAGTFTKASSMTSWPSGTSGIPNGWTVVDYEEPLITTGMICYYDGTSNLKFCEKNDWSSGLGTPIGVVAVPSNHTLDGKVRVMSLKAMNTSTPDDGGANNSMCWGGRGYDAGVSKLTKVPTWDNVIGGTVGNNGYGYMPSDNTSFTGAICACDSKAKYFGYTPYIPSPYLENGNRNTALDVVLTGGNALADFNGKANTAQILSMATAQTDWQTASTITNSYKKGYYPAACCCWRYSTSGTSQGDWYLPAAGELAYIVPRFKEINESLTAVGGITLPSNWFWSSSEFSVYGSYRVNTNYGYIVDYSKSNSNYVRAFLSVFPDGKINNGGVV